MRLVLAVLLMSPRVVAALVVAGLASRTLAAPVEHATPEHLAAVRGPQMLDLSTLPPAIASALQRRDTDALMSASAAAYPSLSVQQARDLWFALLLDPRSASRHGNGYDEYRSDGSYRQDLAELEAGRARRGLRESIIARAARRRVDLLVPIVAQSTGTPEVLDLVDTLFVDRDFDPDHDADLERLIAAARSPARQHWWRVMRLVGSGPDADALPLLDLPISDPALASRASFLRGRILARSGRYAEAREWLQAASGAPDAFETMVAAEKMTSVRAWMAFTLLKLGQPREAEGLLAGTGEAPEVLAEALAARGDLAGARAALEASATGSDRLFAWMSLPPDEARGLPSERWVPDHVRAALATGHEDIARDAMPGVELACRFAAMWSPDCANLGALRDALGPARPAAERENLSPIVPFRRARVPVRRRQMITERDDDLRKVEPPPGLEDEEVVRTERHGSRVVAITRGSNRFARLDSQSYWLRTSRDAGRHYDPPLFLGFGEGMPYLIRSSSKVPLVHGEELRVEVLRHSLDPWMPAMGNPIVLAPEEDLVLRIPLDHLRRDGDGDGLTDLEESFLALDPDHADTDGDGLRDDVDGSPRAALAPAMSDEAVLLEAFFDREATLEWPRDPDADTDGDGVSDGDEYLDHIDELRAAPAQARPAGSVRLTQAREAVDFSRDDIRFVTGDGAFDLEPQRDQRWIAMTRAEMEAYERAHGHRDAWRLTITFSRDRARALMKIDTDTSWTTVRCRREGDHWILEPADTVMS